MQMMHNNKPVYLVKKCYKGNLNPGTQVFHIYISKSKACYFDPFIIELTYF